MLFAIILLFVIYLGAIRRITNNNVKAPICKHSRKLFFPLKSILCHIRICDNGITAFDIIVQSCKRLIILCCFQPKRQFCDFNALRVNINAIQIVLKDFFINIEQRLLGIILCFHI